MATIKIIFRKMLNNRWLTVSLFLGLLITVSLVSSIPTYTSGVLQKLLVGELEDYKIEEQEYPGEFSFSVNYSKDDEINRLSILNRVEELNQELVMNTELPKETEVTILSTSPQRVRLQEELQEKSTRILSLSNIEDHITITDGRLPSDKQVEGVYEALVPEKALLDREMVVGNILTIGEGEAQYQVKPVGTFSVKETNDPYWTLSPNAYSQDFIISEELFKNDLIKNNHDLLETSKFVTAFDYTAFESSDIQSLLNLERKVNAEVSTLMETIILVEFPTQDILSSYLKKGEQLKTMLWSLNIPVLIMLGIYLFMVSRLIVHRQLNEIAVLASRGANRLQIVVMYFIEIAILGLLAFVIGPFIGLQFCKLLGATNGFLEFVNRSALPIEISPESYIYGLVAVFAAIIMVMIPVYIASNQSIIHQKQSNKDKKNHFKWYTLLIDTSLIAIAIYGLFSLQKRQKALASVMPGEDVYMDPILFFLPAIFIIGLGLFLLRIYPFALKIIYRLGEKFWSISLYTTFLQVSRSTKQYQFLMLFLIMTIGVGMYSASAARTINNNLEEQILYKNGADIQLEVEWESNEILAGNQAIAENATTEEDIDVTEEVETKEIVYSEPPFEPYTQLTGVEHATRVFTKDPVKVEAKGNTLFSTEMLGIEPNDFGQTAWFKSTLLPHHWYNYLNLLANEPSAVLISQSVSSSLGVKEGDYLTVEWDGSDTAEFVVYGIIDYWPTFNPISDTEEDKNPSLIVANLPYVQNLMGLEPYHIWLKTDPQITRNELYQAIKQDKLPVRDLKDVKPLLIQLKTSAFLLGINGTLTLGFIISMMITFIGFLLYWILTVKSRTLQYGVYRAMGFPIHKLIGMLVWEQLLTSGMACLFGIVIGGITSRLFVPLFQLSFDPQTIVPPFQVIFDPADMWRIYLFVGFMLVVGLTILVLLLKKIKIHQAIKLGED
ncbi:ABC transporter permease [Gracilibacillus kekensis]|uniref:Putative ABC transport system permease protein n=1 Tax=Gracilibacillus kekensis TaxID=1027249 RepID=A0A1M7N2Z8_9BACI|nr:ABC transporter permease [Gracilibacillus kekensis]SHM97735.1 putative ABC transport system permease protein [Gracilibacillus kekensis]